MAIDNVTKANEATRLRFEEVNLSQDAPSRSFMDKFWSLPCHQQIGIASLSIAVLGFIPTAFVQGFCADGGGKELCTASFVLRPLLEMFVTCGFALPQSAFDMTNVESLQACRDKFKSLSPQEQAGVALTFAGTVGFFLAACLQGVCPLPHTLDTCAAGFGVESISRSFAVAGLALLLLDKMLNKIFND